MMSNATQSVTDVNVRNNNNMLSMIIFNSLSLTLIPYIIGTIFLTFIFLCGLCKIKYIKISDTQDKVTTETIIRSLSKSAWYVLTRLAKGKTMIGSGCFVSREYRAIGYVVEMISNTRNGHILKYDIHLLCTLDNLQKLSGKYTNDDDSNNGQKWTIYGQKWDKEWLSNDLDLKVIVNPKQRDIVFKILNQAENGVVALIYGPPGTGKSAIAEVLASKMVDFGLKPNIVEGYSPILHGCFVEDIMKECPPTKECPLIVSLNEFDGIVKLIEGGITESGEFSQEIISKENMSSYLDKISRFKNVIFIITTNEPIEWWNNPQRKYITRPGRFSHKFELDVMTYEDIMETFRSGIEVYKFPLETKIPVFPDNMTMSNLCNAFRRCKQDIALLYHNLECYPINTTANDWTIYSPEISIEISNDETEPLLNKKDT
jgi:hypothetical protein